MESPFTQGMASWLPKTLSEASILYSYTNYFSVSYHMDSILG